ncbi:MarR family winged helix-turn-helix transcriptional regulator [Gordonia insulae]|uniref:HTH marR-type domain-containing protein n=1 Tax=Gordonia insulae TaxID=2420509 RepID=A0A3G8JTY3_9ACTN|nr:MarR family transcriptional regulator [Gordonia insulae]AZG47640.1 hypothetical protein D7316_04252 [Gordonia insulae]
MPVSSVNANSLDDLLSRIHRARQLPGWRRRLFAGQQMVDSLATVRALRAVEQHAGESGASVRDVADYMAVEHSTASRTVAGLVSRGLLSKHSHENDQRRCVLALTETGRKELRDITRRRHEMMAETVQEWSDRDVETLIELLGRLSVDLERDPSA